MNDLLIHLEETRRVGPDQRSHTLSDNFMRPISSLLHLVFFPEALGCSFFASTFDTLLQRLDHINYYLKLRGPDYTGTREQDGFTFVHNLLHMTGSFTPQPFVAASNTTIALFNGEIYNFRKLERVLRPDGPPYPSDGACILDAYARWGTRFGRHFEGEFAVAVFDLSKRRIIVATDPFGVKPVFVALPARETDHRDGFGVSSYRSGLVRSGHGESNAGISNAVLTRRPHAWPIQ